MLSRRILTLHRSYCTQKLSVGQLTDIPFYKTPEKSPLKHSAKDLSKLYHIPDKVWSSFCDKKSSLCEYLYDGPLNTSRYAPFVEITDALNEKCLMVRKPALEVMTHLSNQNFDNRAVRYVLHGEDGVGKSMTLVHLLHYGLEAGFLIVHPVWPRHWLVDFQTVTPSTYKPDRIDHIEDASHWLSHFKFQNEALLQRLDLKCSKEYIWAPNEVTEKGQSLLELINQGLARPKYSSDIVGALLREIKICTNEKKCRTLVLIDGVNAFFERITYVHKTCREKPKKPFKELYLRDCVPPLKLTLVQHFMKLLLNDWSNAAIVATVDKMAQFRYKDVVFPTTRRDMVSTTNTDSYLPRALLHQAGWEVFDPFVPILVSNYSEIEMENMLDYLIDSNWLQTPDLVKPHGKRQIKFLTGNNPRTLLKYSSSM